MTYGLCLLAGALLFGVAGLFHPMLAGDGAAQLATIAAAPGWRAIHWTLLFALPLLYVGLSGVAQRHGDTAGSAAARGGIRLAAFAFAVWSLNILFMAAGGWSLARAFTVSDTGLTASHAVFVYDMLHPVGLAAERLATFAVGLVVYLFARAMVRAGGGGGGTGYPRWLAWAGFGVAAVSGVIGLVVGEWTPNPYYYGQALIVVWFALTGVLTVISARRRTA